MNRRDGLTLLAATAIILGATLAIADGRTSRLERHKRSPRQSLASAGYREGMAQHRFVVSAATLRAWMAGPTPPVLIDVRAASAYAAGHIAGATSMPLADLLAKGLGADATGKQIVLYDQDGRRTPFALCPLRSGGFDTYLLAGGYAAWFQLGAERSQPGAAAQEPTAGAATEPAQESEPAAAPPAPSAPPPPAPPAVSPTAPQPAGPVGGSEGC